MADLNSLAARIVKQATEPEARKSDEAADPGKDPAAVAESRRESGTKGGSARAAKLSAEQRSEIARRAARARWSKS